MLEIPLRAVPGQMMLVVLGGQSCYLKILHRRGRMYCGLTIEREPVFDGMLVRDRLPLKQSRCQKFAGNLVFIDLEGDSDPQWEGLGTRYRLVYLSEDEALPASLQTLVIDRD